MYMLSPARLVQVWEHALGQHPVDRALTLLSAAYPQLTREELAALTIGERDARLLAMRESLFGSSLKSFAECPQCGAQLEFVLDADDLRLPAGMNPPAASLELVAGDIRLKFRRPNSNDLAAVTKCADVATARRLLSERCVVEAERSGMRLPPADLSESVVDQLATSLAATDTRADNVVALSCATCGHHWELIVDIAAFLWAEVHALAKRLLQEVHALAWAYGWREDDILAMSDARRQFYLELVG